MSEFSQRQCDHCGTLFDPASRTSNPANAAKMRFCSRTCKNASWRDANREKVRETNRRGGAAWYAALDPLEKAARIKQINTARKMRN